MSTTTKPKPRRKKPAASTTHNKPNGEPCDWVERMLAGVTPRRIETKAVEAANLDPSQIDPSPFQPRLEFPEAEINSLAASIASVGLKDPILVRPGQHGRYELIDGERRLRAVRALGLWQIRATIGDFTDAECRQIIWDAADKTEDYGPLEKARHLQAALDAGDAPTQTALAERWGLSQGHVSAYLSMLAFPPTLQKRIISREMPPTHARLIAPYAKHARLAKAVEEEVERMLKWDKQLPATGSFQQEIEVCVDSVTRPIEGDRWSSPLGKRMTLPAFTDEQLAELDVIDVGGVQRAANVKLWEKLVAAEEKRLKDRADARGKKADGKAAKESKASTGSEPAKLSAADVKRLAAEEKRRREEADRKTQNRVYDLWINWQRRLVREKILDATPGQLAAIAVNLLCAEATLHNHQNRRQRLGRDRIAAENVRVPERKDGYWSHPRLLAGLAAICKKDDAGAERVLCDVVMRMYWIEPKEGPKDAEGPSPIVPAGDVCDTVELLGIDLAAEWRHDRLGPLTQPWLEAHTKDQLVDLGRELGVYVEPAKPKTAAVNVLLNQQKSLPMPKELRQPKRPK